MNEQKSVKQALSEEFNKPKAKNVGKNGAKFYKGKPVDQVVPRNPETISAMQAAKNLGKPVRAPKEKMDHDTFKKKVSAWYMKMKAKSYSKRGKDKKVVELTYVPGKNRRES